MPDFMFTHRAATFKGKFIILFSVIFILLTTGTIVFHFAEDWSYVDSFYYSAISLTTRGYGELHPTTTFSKIFTVLYLFIGVAFILYSLSSLIGHYIHYHEPMITQKVNKFVKTISPQKKDKWLVLKAPKQEENQKPKIEI